jgi:hypothetical protein
MRLLKEIRARSKKVLTGCQGGSGRDCRWLFLFLPSLFLMLVILIHYSYGKFFMTRIDPEYFHLYNGIALATLHLDISYIAHPGTPLQMLIAVAAHFVRLLTGGDLVASVVNNPELYIHGANILMNILNAGILFSLGFLTFRYTGRILPGLLMQLIPFGSHYLLTVSARLAAESAVIAPFMLLILLAVKFLYDDQRDGHMHRYAILFALVTGVGIAVKIYFFPLALLPLVVLGDGKNRLRYLLYTILAVMLFAFPLVSHMHKAWEWYGNMFTHSAKWGEGSKGFIDLAKVPSHITNLYKYTDSQIFWLLGLAVLHYLLFLLVPFLRRAPGVKVTERVLLGMILATVLYIAMVLKHFAYHYLIPLLVVKVFFIFLMTILWLRIVKGARTGVWLSLAALLAVVLMLRPQMKTLQQRMAENAVRVERNEKQYSMLMDYFSPDTTMIISAVYYGSPFVAWAHMNGYLMSFKERKIFHDELEKIFPSTYFFISWSDKFYRWEDYVPAEELVKKGKPVYVFIGKGKEENYGKIRDRIRKAMEEEGMKMQEKLLYRFRDPDEYFYRLSPVPSTENDVPLQ